MNDFFAFCQLIATGAAAAAIFIHLGHRDEQLNALIRSVNELRESVAELVKVTVATTTTLQHSQRAAEDIARRIDRLEQARHCRSPVVEEV